MVLACKIAAGYVHLMNSQYVRVLPKHTAPNSLADILGSELVFRKSFSPWLPTSKDAKMLDLGCGYGEFVYVLQREGYARAMGVDRNVQQPEVARRLLVANRSRVNAQEYLRR